MDGVGALDPAAIARGTQVYAASCMACHGAEGAGIPNFGKALAGTEFVASRSDGELLAFIKQGRPSWDAENTTGIDMPPKGGNPAVTDEQLRDVIAYLRSLKD